MLLQAMLLVLACRPRTSYAQQQQSPPPTPPLESAGWKRLDADGNGLISATEFGAFQAWGTAQFRAQPSQTASTTNAGRGTADCACIDPWTSLAATSGSACRNYTDASTKLQICVPADYGAGRCAAHDVGLPPDCGLAPTTIRLVNTVGANRNPKEWCGKEWCYINASTCHRPHDLSGYAWDPATHHGDALSYSYETCGNLNTYSDTRHYETLAGRSLRISFPDDTSATKHAIFTHPETGVRDGSWQARNCRRLLYYIYAFKSCTLNILLVLNTIQ